MWLSYRRRVVNRILQRHFDITSAYSLFARVCPFSFPLSRTGPPPPSRRVILISQPCCYMRYGCSKGVLAALNLALFSTSSSKETGSKLLMSQPAFKTRSRAASRRQHHPYVKSRTQNRSLRPVQMFCFQFSLWILIHCSNSS